jgi:hypothetical protein
MIELPQVNLPSGAAQGSIEFSITSAQMLAEGGIAVRVQIGNAVIDVPAAVLSQAAKVEGASSVRIVSGRGNSLDGADKSMFMLSTGEQGQTIGLPYSFALEILMADGSTETIAAFDGTVSIAIMLTEQEMAALGNPDNLRMGYVNPQTGETEVLESVFDPQTRTLTFHTAHFSVFQMMEMGQVVPGESTNLWWILWVGLGAALVAAIGIIMYTINKRRSNDKVF